MHLVARIAVIPMVLRCVAAVKLCVFTAMAPQPAQAASKPVILAKVMAKGLMFLEAAASAEPNHKEFSE